MEYFLGSLLTFIIMVMANKYMMPKTNKTRKEFRVRYTQSYFFEIIKPYLEFEVEPIGPFTQSQKYNSQKYVRIMILDNNAYWIKDNSFFMADIVDGEINEESTRKVDMMAMDKVELDKMIFIVDKLTEGLSNDSGNSGN